MEYLIAFAAVVGFSVIVGIASVAWACCAVSKHADEQTEKWHGETR